MYTEAQNEKKFLQDFMLACYVLVGLFLLVRPQQRPIFLQAYEEPILGENMLFRKKQIGVGRPVQKTLALQKICEYVHSGMQ